MSNATLEGLIAAARESAATVAEQDAIRKRAESLPGLVKEAGRLERLASISAELADVLPGLQTQIASLAADCAGWRHSRDALAAQAEVLASAHLQLQARRIELDRTVNTAVINDLATRYPQAELEPARRMLADLWRGAAQSLTTVTDVWTHVHTLTIDKLLDYVARSRRA